MSAGLCVLRDVIATANSVMSAGHCVLRDVTDRVLRGLTGERVCEREAVGQAVL